MEVVLWGNLAEDKVGCGRSVITALIKDGEKLTSTASSQVESTACAEESALVIGIEEDGSPIEIILENGQSLFIEEALFDEHLSLDMDLPVRIKYTATLGGHVKSISVVC
ncbi:uncharacterized protein [Diadema antillarum]|uniref:uncharacterized protein n=1 Tax=Diadema antillarum TaxID=105358 RepID=UPI003A879B8F